MKILFLLLVAALALLARSQTLKTRWAAGVTSENAHREYPRPQMVRKDWVNLNGLWQVELRPPDRLRNYPVVQGTILVPFVPESQLSGFHQKVEPQHVLHYSRTFERPKGDRVLLHFGAVDWRTQVFVNGQFAGEHQGGYDPFSFDITDRLKSGADQALEVDVTDPSDKGFQPRGKQVLKPGGIFYTSTSGIWQTVWLEGVPKAYIEQIKIKTWPSVGQVEVRPRVIGSENGTRTRVEALVKGKVVAKNESQDVNGVTVMKIANSIDWSPEHPHLYDLRITLLDKSDRVVDQVTSYFGFREVSLVKDAHGQPRFALNGKPYFLIGPLDQGFWPDGVYTAPSDEAMKYDLEVTKRLGFNMIRKHVKVEPERWYYWCDKLGIAVLQDMPSGDKFIGPNDPDISRSDESAANFKTELKALVDTHFNHPSIVTWVLYNEGWGQWKTEEMTDWLKHYDDRRLVDSTTGWADRGVGDFHDIHAYPGPAAPDNEPNRAIFLGEFGGLGLPVPGHMWLEKGWGYQSFKTSAELTDKFVELITNLRFLQAKGLSGAVYTQTTDCETELNGLMTYDRAMIKMDEARVRKAIADLALPPPLVVQIVPTSEDLAVKWSFLDTSLMPNAKWIEPQFDDSSWPVGPGGFGTPETPGSVVRTRWDTKDIYLRRRFNLDRDYKPGELILRVSHDDDVEVYLDGTQIFQAKGWTTSYIHVPVKTELTRGQHTLAIHCHQYEGGQYVDAGFIRVK